MPFSFLLILVLIFAFGYFSSMNSAGTIIATVISTRALEPRIAILLAVLCMCAGPFLLGAAVVGAMSTDLLTLEAVTTPVVIGAVGGAIIWICIAAWLKFPSSTTQALIGSLVGAALSGFGIQAIHPEGIMKSMLALLLSPLLGIAVGFTVVKLCYWLSSSASPAVNRRFKQGQVAISLLVALSSGSNDGQKLMGIVALGVMATQHDEFVVPYWAAAFSAIAMIAGTFLGGRHIAQTLGTRLYKVEPIHGFGAQTASGLVLLSASILGGPVSGSQVITSAIVGAGSAQRARKVRWQLCRQIFNTWVLTLPMSALFGAGIYILCVHLNL